MINSITLLSSSSQGQEPTTFEPAAVTVLVGPNNGGKSTLLREIDAKLDPRSEGGLTIRAMEFEDIPAEALNKLAASGQKDDHGAVRVARITLEPGGRTPGGMHCRFQERDGQWVPDDLAACFKLFSVALDGRTRLTLLQPAERVPWGEPALNHINRLFRDDQTRRRLAALTHDAFGVHLTIDAATRASMLVVRFAERLPDDPAIETNIVGAGHEFHSKARDSDSFSDGVKAYTGILAAALATEFRLILVDEPEAFLHPPLSHRLGRSLADIASERRGQIIAATHDADFLMGAVQSGKPVAVVRLTYSGGVATSRVLKHEQLTELVRDPLLRSTGILRGLFHRGVVVCEADKDRAFYQECNERLIVHTRNGAAETLFVNSQNKQTVSRVIAPLRSMGIPAAAIVDFDVLKDEIFRVMRNAGVPEPERARMEARVKALQALFAAKDLPVDRKGLAAFGSLPDEARSLIADLARFGVFVVPVGDVEDWLKSLVNRRKEDWLPAMLDALGGDPTEGGYVMPAAGDVWDFLRGVARWIDDPQRLGMPP